MVVGWGEGGVGLLLSSRRERTLCGLKPEQLWLADRRQDNETSLVRRMFVRKMHRDVVGINCNDV